VVCAADSAGKGAFDSESLDGSARGACSTDSANRPSGGDSRENKTIRTVQATPAENAEMIRGQDRLRGSAPANRCMPSDGRLNADIAGLLLPRFSILPPCVRS
jgi:hypothetical protein